MFKYRYIRGKKKMTTGRTIWDYISENPRSLIKIIVLAAILTLILGIALWCLGYRLSPSIGWIVKNEIGSEFDRRFAQAYIDTRDFKDSRLLTNVKGVNIERVEYHENPRRYTIYFKQPFPSRDYVAVANSTRGFVHITINTPDSVSLVDYDVASDSNIVPGPAPGKETGQISLLVYWPQDAK